MGARRCIVGLAEAAELMLAEVQDAVAGPVGGQQDGDGHGFNRSISTHIHPNRLPHRPGRCP